MSKKSIITLVIVVILLFAIIACIVIITSNINSRQSENSNIENNMKEAEKVENEYKTISPEEAKKQIDNGEDILILDVREQNEYDDGHIPNSTLLPLGEIEEKVESQITNKDQKIFVYCRTGVRSKYATNILIQKNYTNVYDMGGIVEWPYDIVVVN